MTDTNAANPSPEPSPLMFPGSVKSDHQDGAASPWETVTFPDQLAIADGRTPSLSSTSQPIPTGSPSQLASPALSTPLDQPNPEDLVTLIQDLNHCNDALLQRVGELEEALERSQAALQSELERYQGQPSPGPASPPQVAQLLSELDIANDGLRRTTIHNQTLQSELEVGHQRIAQLERECTLLQDRLGEKSAALVKVDATCRDLKSRLHRQQQYTLQFKAALEKCLNTTPVSASDSETNPGLTMPKADQIKPWSVMPEVDPGQSSLTQLWHSLNSTQKTAPSATAALPQPQPLVASSPLDPAAVTATPQPEPASVPDPWQIPPAAPLPAAESPDLDVAFTEPSPWGTPLPSGQATPKLELEPDTMAVAVVSEDPGVPTLANPSVKLPSQSAQPNPGEPTLPKGLSSHRKASPSPLLYPLRSPKKITSLAAVDLPSFGRRQQS
jgi:hypothetical protein